MADHRVISDGISPNNYWFYVFLLDSIVFRVLALEYFHGIVY